MFWFDSCCRYFCLSIGIYEIRYFESPSSQASVQLSSIDSCRFDACQTAFACRQKNKFWVFIGLFLEFDRNRSIPRGMEVQAISSPLSLFRFSVLIPSMSLKGLCMYLLLLFSWGQLSSRNLNKFVEFFQPRPAFFHPTSYNFELRRNFVIFVSIKINLARLFLKCEKPINFYFTFYGGFCVRTSFAAQFS